MAVKVTEHKPLPRQFPCILKWVPNPGEEMESLPTIVFFYEHAGEVWGINLCSACPHPENYWINPNNPQWVPTTVIISQD
jgi:hypothetical protein